jgi:hypothetical protein
VVVSFTTAIKRHPLPVPGMRARKKISAYTIFGEISFTTRPAYRMTPSMTIFSRK